MCGMHIGGVEIVKSLIKRGYKFSYFVLIDEKIAKKNNASGYYDYSDIAQLHNIPVYYAKSYSLKDREDIFFFQNHQFDILIQGGWQRLFPSEVLDTLSIGALGFHGSCDLLPKGRGRSPMNWSIIENKKRFLMHLFLIKPGADDGDIIEIMDFDINEYDDIESMYMKYAISNRNMLLKALPKLIDGSYKVIPQRGIPSYYPKRTEEDGRINWEEMDVFYVDRLIRAVSKPYPGAIAVIDHKEYIIWKARIFDTRINYPEASYGEIVERFGDKIIVNCRSGLLLIEEYSNRSKNG